MNSEEREKQIDIALRHMMYKLKARGADLKAYNRKYLRDKAEKIVDEYFKETGEFPYKELKE